MTSENNQWSQANSDVYRQLAAVAVPERALQIAALLTLLPFDRDERFRVVELASGEGRLAHAILHAFPNAHLLALDLEESMRLETAQRLQQFGSRAAIDSFDMAQPDWYPHIEGADAVVSSLCVHHLDAEQKQALFAAVCQRLSARGVFLMADLVLPQSAGARRLFAATWDDSAQTQSIALTGDQRLFELFAHENWNYYHYPDPFDKPSPLFDQLAWLKGAGFTQVDCFWMQAGHAIYGGCKPAAADHGIAYEDALRSARIALAD